MKRNIFFSLAIILCLFACKKQDVNVDVRQEMRNFVIGISQTARAEKSNFIVIPQNGIELVTMDDDCESDLAANYLAAIDGHGQEDLFYGYDADDKATSATNTNNLLGYLKRSQAQGKVILVTDYCSTSANVTDSYTRNNVEGFISFAAHQRNLDQIPATAIYNENAQNITKLSEAQNFLYLINPENYTTKQAFIDAVCATNYDAVIMDLFLDEQSFSADEVAQLRRKANGGTRLVIAYMSIGEAEDYRFYWDNSWKLNKPSWMEKENPEWKGNYKVRYWDKEWQNIIYGTPESYLSRILAADFDGVYLDIIDAFEYFE